MGVWIEIKKKFHGKVTKRVTPFVGVWIEIGFTSFVFRKATGSLPSWECGLKSLGYGFSTEADDVTPFVGVWIEIFLLVLLLLAYQSHSLRGSVD